MALDTRPSGDQLARLLRRRVRGVVDSSDRRRAEYSSDASNYRVVPAAVVFPEHVDDIVSIFEVCRDTGVPLTPRGAGTSVAGNAVGAGVVVDTSRHLNRVVSVDPDARLAVVEPGVILDDLQRAAARYGLRFGPDPSTHARCTLGGMIGNNACGPRALTSGKTSDNTVALDVLTGTGQRLLAAAGHPLPVSGLEELMRRHLATARTELGRFGRQVSGYSLEHLLPERGRDLAKALVGTEGTCALVLGATVRLVSAAPITALVVLGYPDMATAAEAVPAILPHAPLAIEGIDARLVDVVRARKGPGAVPALPPGGGWLFVEVAGGTTADARGNGTRLAADAGALGFIVVTSVAETHALWRIREDGVGLAGRTPSGQPAWPGLEDAAVPPAALGQYLRQFDALLDAYGLNGLAYGHFGEGCIHARIDFPLADNPGRFRDFMTDAAKLVASHGGSLSGEHGDGRARSELLGYMYSPEALAAFAEFKHVFDPEDLLNPGVLVHPRPIDSDLRLPAARSIRTGLAFAYGHDGGDFSTAVHRCVGVGKCRADLTGSGVFMCPSFLATRDERDSTRGRARVLQEMANGTVVRGGWRSAEVHDVLDLCLQCKACSSDCPAGVDMATYKAEVLHQTYRRRLRPAAHYTLGWLPRWARLAAAAPGVTNAVLGTPAIAALTRRLSGIDHRRHLPVFAQQPFRQWFASRPEHAGGDSVVLWVDTFTNSFSPHVGHAAVEVLEDAGFRVLLTREHVCCGLTWITTGQLDAARRRLRKTVNALAPHVAAGIPVVGLEPSCTAVLRSDLVELLPNDEGARAVQSATRTLAELLTERRPDWTPPSLAGVSLVAQPHCHHHSVMGYGADQVLLRRARADLTTVAGCCGLAGNFGVERGHYEVSVAIAEHTLLPTIRRAPAGAIVLADGFSCRLQLADLAQIPAAHLAQVLRDARRATSAHPI